MNQQAKTKREFPYVSLILVVTLVLVVAILGYTVVDSIGIIGRMDNAAKSNTIKLNEKELDVYRFHVAQNQYYTQFMYYQYGLMQDTYGITKMFASGADYANYMIPSTLGSEAYDASAYAYAEQYLAYCEGAKDAGLYDQYKADVADDIDEYVEGLKETAKINGVSFSKYLRNWIGKGMTEGVIRTAMEYYFIAGEYATKLQKDYSDAATVEEIEKYVEDNKASFYTADVLKYTISTLSKDFENDMLFEDAKKAAVEEANKIMAAKSADEFVELVKAYEAAKSTSTSTETVDADKYKTTVAYQTSDDLGKWLFEEKADVNATKVVEATNDKTETIPAGTAADGTKTEEKKIAYKEHTATVYLVIEPMHLDKDLTKNAGYFMSDDKALVEKFLAEFKAGTLNHEEFQKAAEKFYNELHEGHDHSEENTTEPILIFEGVEKLQDNYFPEPYDVLGEWLDADDREENSFSDIIEIVVDKEKNTVYYGFGYFEKYCEETWYVNGYNATVSQQFEDWAENQKKNVTPVTVNNKAVTNSITPLAWTVDGADSHEGHDHD